MMKRLAYHRFRRLLSKMWSRVSIVLGLLFLVFMMLRWYWGELRGYWMVFFGE